MKLRKNSKQNKFIFTSSFFTSFVFFVLSFLFLNINLALADNYFVSNPANCPTDAFSQTCVGGLKVCGVNSSNVVSCSSTGSINPPGSSTSVSSGTVNAAGGYMLDCYAYDGADPRCDNNGSDFCFQNSTCNGLAEVTICTGGQWAASTCGTCKPGYNSCDGNSANGCSGATEHDGVTCTTGLGLPGTYLNCVCVGSILKLGSDSVSGSTSVIQSTVAPALFVNGYSIGIGTSTPSKPLEVAGTGQAKFDSYAYGTTPLSTDLLALTTVEYVNGLAGLNWRQDGNTVGSLKNFGTIDNFDLPFITSSTEKMRISAGGNVGIGTTAPDTLLHIYGTNAIPIHIQRTNSANASIQYQNSVASIFTGIGASNNYYIALGADLANNALATFQAGGNVGIGTTNPGYKLEVTGTFNLPTTNGIRFDNTNNNNAWYIHNSGTSSATLSFGIGAIADANDKIVFNNSGNVGIGTSTPGAKLHVAGNVLFDSLAHGSTPPSTDLPALATVEYVNGYTLSSSTISNKWSKGGDTVGSLKNFGTLDPIDLPFITSSTERMRITSAGNVGIGTTVPGAFKLNVSGANNGIYVSNGSGNFNSLLAENVRGDYKGVLINHLTGSGTGACGGDGCYGFKFDDKRFNNLSGVYGASFQIVRSGTTTISNLFQVDSHGTNALSVTDSGKVGIGTTAPGAILDVHGVGTTTGITLQTSDSAGTAKVTFLDSGSVGIGTTNPAQKLDINGAGASLGWRTTSGNTDYFHFTRNGVGSAVYINQATTTQPILRLSAGSEAANTSVVFTVEGSGSVGIGTTSPSKLLEVNGQPKFNNFAYGVTPLSTDLPALTTVEYVNGIITSSTSTVGIKWTKGGDTVGSLKNFGTLDNFDLPFITSSTERMRIQSVTGNVGIGTTNPVVKLDVRNGVVNIGTISDGWNSAGLLNVIKGSIYNSESTGAIAVSTGITAQPELIFGVDSTSTVSYIQSLSRLTSYSTVPLILQPNGGNVGIGTTTPAQKLEVNGRIRFQDYFEAYYGGSTLSGRFGSSYWLTTPGGQTDTSLTAVNNIYFAPGNTTTPSIIFKAGGNVGIGTSTPIKLLEVNGMAKFYNYAYGLTPASTDIGALATVEYVNGFIGTSTVNNKWSKGGDTVGSIKTFGTIDSFDLPFITNNNERMRILAGGNVGIGTTTPDIKFQVIGGAVGLSNNSPLTWRNTSGTVNDGEIFLNTSNQLEFWSGTGDTIIFKSNNGSTEWMRMGGGSLGIGTTAPSSRLDVHGVGTTTGITLQTSDSAGAAKVTFLDSGNVGIGITNPTATLHVVDLATSGVTSLSLNGRVTVSGDGVVKWGSAADYGGLTWNTGLAIMGAQTGKALAINSNGAEKIRIDTTGNVGIGTTTPAARFHVYGNGSYSAIFTNGSVGIGTTTPAKLLEVNGMAKFNNFAYGSTPLSSDNYAVTTVEYVKNSIAAATSTIVTIPSFVGATSVTVTGNNSGYGTGYTNANNICNNAGTGYLGSHVCTSFEVLNSISKGIVMPANDLWIFAGPPAYTASANDCEGRTTAAAAPTSYGAYWQAPNASYPQGRGLLGSCSAAIKLACCK